MIEVLTFLRYYLPGYTAGGPIRTISNLVDQLGDEFKFKIITSHTDPRDPAPYDGIERDVFHPVGKALVYYASPSQLSRQGLRKLVGAVHFDILYLNSFLDPHFTISPLALRRLGIIPKTPVVIAPRGEFSPGALALGKHKKRLYISAANTLGLYKDVIWQASSKYEAVDIRRWFGDRSRVEVAPNLPESIDNWENRTESKNKVQGRLKVLFLSRIARKKNLDSALRMLQGLDEAITFDIYGPLEDKTYWVECQKLIDRLPPNIEVNYKGTVPHEQVASVMAPYDLFFFPTLGENYGHVIFEALSAGCPVLISDQTPWRNLEAKGIGWDIPLEDEERFREALRTCVAMDREAYGGMVNAALEFACSIAQSEEVVEQNRALFINAMQAYDAVVDA